MQLFAMYFRHNHARRHGAFAQHGRGFANAPFHRNPFVQRGGGFGNVVRTIFKASVPALKFIGQQLLGNTLARNVGTSLKQSALRGVQSVARDVLAGKNVAQSFNNSLARARRDVAETVRAHSNTSGGDLNVVTAVKRKAAARPAAAARRDRWQQRAPAKKRVRTSVFTNVEGNDGGGGGRGGSSGED